MSFLKNLSMFFGLRDDENYNPEEVDSDRSSIKEKFSKGEVPIQHTSKRFSHFKNLSSDHLNKKLFEKKN